MNRHRDENQQHFVLSKYDNALRQGRFRNTQSRLPYHESDELMKRCFAWRRFILPETISLECSAQVSRLTNLPVEIQLLILAECTPNDRIALALSCKKLMELHRMEPLEVPRFNAHCAPFNASMKWEHNGTYLPACPCGGLERLLRQICPHLPFGRPARTRQLCIDCLTWLPRRASYWKEKADRFRNEFWDKNHDAEWRFQTKIWSKGLKMQCPKCCFIEKGDGSQLVSIWLDNDRRIRMMDIERRHNPKLPGPSCRHRIHG